MDNHTKVGTVRELDRPETLSAAAARHIGEAIVRGDFAPGAPLPEISLAARLKVSRGTVREALRALNEQGLVETYPHRGAVVAPVTVRKVRETYSLRMLLEPHAARLAAEQGGLADALPDIEAALAELQAAARRGNAADFVEADLAFHETVIAQCDHEALLEILATIRKQVRRFMFWGRIYDTSKIEVEFDQHADLVAVFQAGDPDQIEASVRAHIERAGETLVARLIALGAADELEPGGMPAP